MFKKLTAILMPLVLAPLGSLLTPAIARADDIRLLPTQKCVFPEGSPRYVSWAAVISVRRDKAAHINRIMFGDAYEFPEIRQFVFWESRKLNGVEKRYSQQTYNFIPPIDIWGSDYSDTATWISTLGNRYINVWFYDRNGRVCTDKIEF